MPRYYLHIRNAHGDAEDEEGADLTSLAEAVEKAITGIRSLLSSEALNGRVNLNGHVDISDEAGKVLHKVPFADALKVVGGN